ncbi:DUF6799 domain-containing protein [Daejeonella oryzae]|uniref:DUF6799 domain-containing protein n=1 Tax=Daejeonella oryzae TaxID=1122943 RepID=UPI000479F247|nr:DUF6799 domain-containing protein [Daejeonella oryzae]
MKKMTLLFLLFLLFNQTEVAAQDMEREKQQKQDRIHTEDHLRLQDGQLYLYKNGVQSQVREKIQLKNGGTVNPDGSYMLQNQERFQLRNGECMDMNGNRYLNQNKFNKGIMMKNKNIERIRTKSVNQNRPAGQGGVKKKSGSNRNEPL